MYAEALKFDPAQPRDDQGRFVTLYHGTREAHVESIRQHGLKPSKEGLVWATESREAAQTFAEGLNYPEPTPDATVVEIRAPRSAFFYEKPLVRGRKIPKGQRTARFAGTVPPEWIVKKFAHLLKFTQDQPRDANGRWVANLIKARQDWIPFALEGYPGAAEAVANLNRLLDQTPEGRKHRVALWDPDQPRGKGGRWIKRGIPATMAAFKAKYPAVAKNYPRSTHTEMGSIESHTTDVGREWQTQLTPEDLKGISDRFGSDVEAVMMAAIPLHDIGKAEAIESGAGKHKQHEFTQPIMEDVLRQEGFSDKDITLATELTNHDLIGPLFRAYEGFSAKEATVIEALKAKAKKVGMPVADFVKLQLAFYQADAAAYPYITQYMKQEPSGKWTFAGSPKIKGIEALLQSSAVKFDPAQPRDERGRWASKFGSHAPESGYIYHATNEENAADIAQNGLQTHGPSYGTDQETWPDWSTERRSYWTRGGGRVAASFAPEEGKPVLLRVKESAVKPKTEQTTGDVYLRKIVKPEHIEVLHEDGKWYPLVQKREYVREPAGAPESKGGQFAKAGEGGTTPSGEPLPSPRTFTSDEGYEFHEKGPVLEWAKQVPYNDQRAISNYAGFGYKSVNNQLRGKLEPRLEPETIRPATPEEVAKAKEFSMTEEWFKQNTDMTLEQYKEKFGYSTIMSSKPGPPDDPYHRLPLGPNGEYMGHVVHIPYTTTDDPANFVIQRLAPNLKPLQDAQAEADTINALIRERGYELPEAMMVRRGAYIPGLTMAQLKDMVGDVWEEQGFTSTSVGSAQGRQDFYPVGAKDESLYDRYGNKMNDHHGEVGAAIQFHIELPKGTKIASVEALRRMRYEFLQKPIDKPKPDDIEAQYWMENDYSKTPTPKTGDLEDKDRRSESELLLGSGARFRVKEVRRGKPYHRGGGLPDTDIIEVHLEYIGGGSSEGVRH